LVRRSTSIFDAARIGLSICRTIIEAHEGRLSASQAAGGGSAFQIALPADETVS